MKRTTKVLWLAILALVLVCNVAIAQNAGSFKGKLIEYVTKQPIVGAMVTLDSTKFRAISDTGGVFIIRNIPAGSYAVTISGIGFQTKTISEIIVNNSKTYYSEFEMLEQAKVIGEVSVRVFRGELNPLTPVSTYSFSREEIFRTPGSAGDIMRVLSTLPGVVTSGSQFSTIAARGQGTQDNLYMVDDIPMFNLSHLEAEGVISGFNDPNGGRFSIFAPRIIDNVQFQNGGYDASFGRRSSSYLGLGIKEGNTETWSYGGQFDLLGATLIIEGPLSKKTSIFASGRYQNLTGVIQLLGASSAASVSFGDYLVKTTTHINAKHKLSFVAMYNPERPYNDIDRIEEGTNINDDNGAGTTLFDHRGSKTLVGLNLRSLVGSNSYWKNVLYYRAQTVDNTFGRFNPSLTADGEIIDPKFGGYERDLRTIRNNQTEIGYRSIYTKNLEKVTFTGGIDAAVVSLDYARNLKRTDTSYVFRSTDFRANPTQNFLIVDPARFNSAFNTSAFNTSGYVCASWSVLPGFVLNPSLRLDYTGFTEELTLSPRLSGSVNLNSTQSINFSSGIYYQDVAYSDIGGQSGNTSNLKNERTFQSILGYKIQFTTDLKFVVEGWYKQFDNVRVQPNITQSFISSSGNGEAHGFDISLTKRLSKKYYGQVSYSFMESNRNDNNGLNDYDYIFNIPHTISVLGSYKPNNKWIFSSKFRYSTGRPTDEFVVYSDVHNNPNNVRYAQEITQVNGKRLPDFFSLDVRVDYSVPMSRGVFSVFVDFVNVTNTFNVNSERFIPETGRLFNVGLGIFPTFGLRVDL